ncbi:MAG: hypothetical protein ACOY0T_32340 [Myxococcota bacterium]
MRWLRVVGSCACLLALAPPARGEEKVDVAFPLGLRARHVESSAASSFELGVAATVTGAGNGYSGVVDCIASIGSDGSRLTGTFAYTLTYGVLLGEDSQGLALRFGADILVDSLGSLRASHLSLPLVQTGYAYSDSTFLIDVGIQSAPILAGRMRQDDAARYMGLGAKAGPYLAVMLPNIGLSARFTGDHLVASTSEGGASDWARGLVCVSFGWVDACADGLVSRFAPTDDAKAITMGYAGGTVGVDFTRIAGAFGYQPR